MKKLKTPKITKMQVVHDYIYIEMKPEKYITKEIITNILRNLQDAAKIGLLGYWYCYHCKTWHSPMVKKYSRHCSLGQGKELKSNVHVGKRRE